MNQRLCNRNTIHRRGYVLLVTLTLLVLSTSLLVAVGRSAAHHALQARLEQNDLQRRWGVASCRSAVLGHAEQILSTQEQQQRRAMPEFRETISLGADTFTLIVSDEQAKANINEVIEQFGREGAEDRIRQGLIGSGLVNAIRLRPGVIESDDGIAATQPAVIPQLIFGPGQMFDAVEPARLMNVKSGGMSAMRSLTCWGSGTLNLLRADQQSMRLSLVPALTNIEISKLIAARDAVMQIPITSHLGGQAVPAGNTDAVGSLLAQAKIDSGRRNKLALTSRSRCHSLWIIVEDGRREWYSLSILDETKPIEPVMHSLVW